MDDNKRLKSGIFTSIVGIIVNLILATAKLIAGILTSSISIIADSINNYTDTCSSTINLIGFKISAKPADEDHPFGHKRMEYISALILAVIILAVTFELILTSIKGIINPEAIEVSIIAITILTFSIVVKAFLGIYYYANYKKLNSLALKAASEDSRNDCITTSIVLIGMIVYHFTSFEYTDYICGIIVGFIIMLSAVSILKDTISPLLGESIDPALFKSIMNDLKSENEILGLHDPECHVYGAGSIFMSVHAEIDGSYPLEKAHNIIDRCEDRIKEKYNVNLVIHADPMNMNKDAIELKNKINEILLSINPKLFLHDFHYGDNKNVSFECIKPRDADVENSIILEVLKKELPEITINVEFEYGYINSEDLNLLKK